MEERLDKNLIVVADSVPERADTGERDEHWRAPSESSAEHEVAPDALLIAAFGPLAYLVAYGYLVGKADLFRVQRELLQVGVREMLIALPVVAITFAFAYLYPRVWSLLAEGFFERLVGKTPQLRLVAVFSTASFVLLMLSLDYAPPRWWDTPLYLVTLLGSQAAASWCFAWSDERWDLVAKLRGQLSKFTARYGLFASRCLAIGLVSVALWFAAVGEGHRAARNQEVFLQTTRRPVRLVLIVIGDKALVRSADTTTATVEVSPLEDLGPLVATHRRAIGW